MKGFGWNEGKNAILRKSRGVSFNDVVLEIAEGGLLDMLVNANHPGQILYVVRLRGYVHCVPAIIRQDVIQLITIYPSRKMNDKYKETLQ